MKRYISISVEIRDALMAKYKVSRQAVWAACNFTRRGQRPDAIRKDALAMGGRYIEENFIPQCTFNRTDEGWEQRFAAGVVVTVVGNDVVITRGKKTVAEFEEVNMNGFGNICAQAQMLAETGRLEMNS